MSNKRKVNKLSKEVANELKKLFRKVKPELVIEDDSESTSIRFGYICSTPKVENWGSKAHDVLDNLRYKLIDNLGISEDHYWEDYVGSATPTSKNRYLIEGLVIFGKTYFE
jgi:hypothetical protein